MLATLEYNRTIHNLTKEKPFEALRAPIDKLDKIKKRLIKCQNNSRSLFNKNRGDRVFEFGQMVYVKVNKRVGNKLSSRYLRRRVKRILVTLC